MRLSRLIALTAAPMLVPVLAVAQGVAPTVPVPNRQANDNSSAPANTRYVDAAVQALLNAIAGKAPVANPSFLGTLTAPAATIAGSLSAGTISGDGSPATARAPGATASRDLTSWLGATHFNVASVAGLRAWPVAPLVSGAAVRTSGYYAAGDDGGATYTWSPTSTAADDGCGVIRPTGATGAGRWLFATKGGGISVRQCGAKGDAAANDTAPIQAAITYAEATSATTGYWSRAGGGSVYLNPGSYAVSGIDTRLPIRLWGDAPGSVTLILIAGSNRSVIRDYAAPASDGTQRQTFGGKAYSGFTIDGNKGSNATSDGLEFVDALFTTPYGTTARIDSVNIVSAKGNGIYAGLNRNLMLADKLVINYCGIAGFYTKSFDHSISNSSIGANGQGISVYTGGALTVTNTALYNNTFAGLVAEDWASYIDIKGGSIGANGAQAIYATQATANNIASLLVSNTHIADNSQSAPGANSHIYLRNTRAALSTIHFQQTAGLNRGAYLIDNDATSTVSISGLTYRTDGVYAPYTSAPFALPALLGGGTNTQWVAFAPAWSGVTNGAVGASSGRYRLVDSTLDIEIDTAFTFTGTPPNNLVFTLPLGLTARASAPVFGSDYTTGRGMVQAQFVAGQSFAGIVRYDNAPPAQNNSRLVFSGRLEVR